MEQYNIINVDVSFDNLLAQVQGCKLAPRLVSGDYNSTKMVFTFDRDYGQKTLEIKSKMSGDVVFVGEIQNNEVILCGVEDGTYYSIFNEAGDYICEVSLYGEDSKLTALSFILPVAQEQIVIGDEVIEPYMPLFDTLIQQISEAITETNNLNIEAEKVDSTTTITITHKDGTEQEVQILDGEKGDKGDKGDAGAIKMVIVNELPSTGADDTIYLVPNTEPETSNNFDEYVYVNGAWEKIGGIQVEVDLTDYVKNTDYATSSKGGVFKALWLYGVQITTNGELNCPGMTYQNYTSGNNNMFISKGTLENVITGKGLVNNTNYATTSTGGVIKTGFNGFGASNGETFVGIRTYAQYQSESNNLFIGKGTLENVLNARIGDIDSVLDSINNEVV